MDIVVLKFGGSSLANNERLVMVANKIIENLNICLCISQN